VSVDPDVLQPLRARLRADHDFEVDVGHLTVFGRCAEGRECLPAEAADEDPADE
jgi:Fur family ferric uptake transcriptional regulator